MTQEEISLIERYKTAYPDDTLNEEVVTSYLKYRADNFRAIFPGGPVLLWTLQWANQEIQKLKTKP